MEISGCDTEAGGRRLTDPPFRGSVADILERMMHVINEMGGYI